MKSNPPGRLPEFTKPECDYFRENCNFSEEERAVFDLKVKGKTTLQIGIELSISESTVVRLTRRVKRKIVRLL